MAFPYTKSGSSIPQSVIQNDLDSAFAQFDSQDPILHLIQLVDAVVSIEPWKTEGYFYYYDSEGALPAQDSALEGMMAFVTRPDTRRVNELYVNTSKEWKLLQDLDSTGESFQGEVRGFVAGGLSNPGTTPLTGVDYWPFATEGTAVDAGDLNRHRTQAAPATSPTAAFIFGGDPSTTDQSISKFNKATSITTEAVGDLSNVNDILQGPDPYIRLSGVSEEYNGYVVGLRTPAPGGNLQYMVRYPYSNENIIGYQWGSGFSTGGVGAAGHTSGSTGYLSGGRSAPGGQISTILSFPFASEVEASPAGGSLNLARQGINNAGVSSPSDGFTAGGYIQPSPSPTRNAIDKFPFASITPVTDVGDLSVARRFTAGVSGPSDGYAFGGQNATSTSVTVIDKYSYTTPFITATNSGDLSGSRTAETMTGHQQ